MARPLLRDIVESYIHLYQKATPEEAEIFLGCLIEGKGEALQRVTGRETLPNDLRNKLKQEYLLAQLFDRRGMGSLDAHDLSTNTFWYLITDEETKEHLLDRGSFNLALLKRPDAVKRQLSELTTGRIQVLAHPALPEANIMGREYGPDVLDRMERVYRERITNARAFYRGLDEKQ